MRERGAGPPAHELVVRDLAVRYGHAVSLSGVSLDLPTGVHALVGANAAGKSTLLKALAGVVRLGVNGSAALDGHDLRVRSGRRGRVVYLPQRSEFPRGTTVAEALDFAGWLYRLSKSERRARSAQVAACFDVGLATRVDTLSGGTVARVALAQAWMSDAPLVLLDEPVAGIDFEHRVDVRNAIAERGRAAIVVMATHHHDDIAALADRVLVLDGGRLVADLDAVRFLELGDGDVESALRSCLEEVRG